MLRSDCTMYADYNEFVELGLEIYNIDNVNIIEIEIQY